MSGRARVAWVVGLLLLAFLAHFGRRTVIRVFFTDGAGGEPAPALQQVQEPGPRVAPVDRLRVMVIDGLSRAHARTLPHLNRLCATGLDLVVDNGFPTVSLPVQHVLWTGLTQQQSGVQYRIPRIDPPAAGALPAAVPGSRAVAESHPDIVHSFGFAEAWPPDGMEEPVYREAFASEAARVVAGDASLVFVHVLRVDEAGHASGAASNAYADAAGWSDDLLGELTAAGGEATWVVLADHGHRPDGGHGGADPEIRRVRGCVFGPGVEGMELPGGRSLHLVDLSRLLFDLAGRRPGPEAVGRPLAAALAHPDPDATLPRPGPVRWVGAGFLLLLALFVVVRLGAGVWSAPLWIVVAYGGVVGLHGVPSLSIPAIYPPLGRDLMLAASGGFATLILQLWLGRHHGPPLLGSLLAAPLLGTVGLFVLVAGTPPLMPRWTAELSLWLGLLTGASAILGVATLFMGRARGSG